MAVGRFFFSAAPPAQNSPELHFRFIIFFYPTFSARIFEKHIGIAVLTIQDKNKTTAQN